MKIADTKSIKAGEREMILAIMKKIDPEVLSTIGSSSVNREGIEFVDGDMEIVENRIVYKMHLRVTLDMAVMFDREGNLVGNSVLEKLVEDEDPLEAVIEDDVLEQEDEGSDMFESKEDPSTAGIEPMEDETEIKEDVEEDIETIAQNNREFWDRRRQENSDEI